MIMQTILCRSLRAISLGAPTALPTGAGSQAAIPRLTGARTRNNMQRNAMLKASAVVATLMAGATPSLALAQNVGGQTETAAAPVQTEAPIAEVVVTATRQSQVLRKVPASIVAITQEKLDEAGATNIGDIARLAPGVTVNTNATGAGTNQNIAIRGISSTVGAATTGIYIDDTPIHSRALTNATTNAYPLLFDLERVEVLRGPQGTLFGAGAEGGAVRFITPQPSLNTFSGSVRAGIAATERGGPSNELGGAVGGPIVADVLGFRISGVTRHDGGFVDRSDRFTGVVHEHENKNDSYSVRGALTWKASNSLSVTASVLHQDTRAPGSPVFYENVSNVTDGRLLNQLGTEQLRNDKFTLPTVSITADLGSAQFISTTSYLKRDASIRADTTLFIPTVLFGNPLLYKQGETSYATINDAQKNWSQEFRLQSKTGGPLSWTVGAYFQNARQEGSQVNFDPYADALSVRSTGLTIQKLTGVALVNGTDLFHTNVSSIDKQAAIFGEATYEISNGLKVIGGARFARSTVELARSSSGPVAGAGGNFQASQKESPVTPRLGLSWQATPLTMYYTTAAKGFRVGGVNSPVLSLCQASIAASGLSVGETYKSDSVWSYEVGAKTRSQDGAFAVAASAFTIDWSNIQNSIALTGCGSAFTANLGKARSRGGDISVDARPLQGLLMNLSVAYVDAKLSQTIRNGNALLGAQGDKIGISPWGISASARYEFPITDTKNVYLRADYQYNDKSPQPNVAVIGTDPLAVGNEAFNQLSLRGGVLIGDYDVSIYANNVLNEHPIFGRARDSVRSPLFYATTARPRTVGLTASLRF